jgi:hypothetical protein
MWNKRRESMSLPQPNQKNYEYGGQKRKERFGTTEYRPIKPSG